jgi:hypothetical protein
MSVVAPEQQQPAASPQITAVPPPVAPALPTIRPRITANRKLLVRRFPSLSFTIWTGGLPYWEVFLFTDRSLIDPRNASRRTPSNFYTSRQDGGLRLGQDGDVFLVPSAVLRAFAAAVPAPTAIYYTVAAYATPDGGSPALPEPPEVLALDAPFVAVSSDFTPDTVSQILGVHSTRLQVVAQALAEPVAAARAPAVEPAPAAARILTSCSSRAPRTANRASQSRHSRTVRTTGTTTATASSTAAGTRTMRHGVNTPPLFR